MGRGPVTSTREPSTPSVAPLFSRSLHAVASTAAGDQRERTLKALRRAKRGEPDALEYLYRQYAPGVFAYVRRMLRDEYEAQDVTQQVFVKLATSLDKYDARRAEFSTWLLRISHKPSGQPPQKATLRAAERPSRRGGGPAAARPGRRPLAPAT